MTKSFIIIGGGPCGLTTALALHRLSYRITIFELRSTPSTIGGAVNLVPSALELLKLFDIDTSALGSEVDKFEFFALNSGSRIGELSLSGPRGVARRVKRKDLQGALLRKVEEAGIVIVYGAKFAGVEDDAAAEQAVVKFADGRRASADVVLGCDGTHSAVRHLYVDPDRKREYRGIAAVQTIVPMESIRAPVPFAATGVHLGQSGSLITSFCEPKMEDMFIASVGEVKEAQGKDGWKAMGADREKTIEDIRRRFGSGKLPAVKGMLDAMDKEGELFYYPIYSLEAGGQWSKGRVLLLGDAAHSMPPQGESTGFAIEDGVLLTRILQKFPDKPLSEIFASYEKTRRPRIDDGLKIASTRSEHFRDHGWLRQTIIEWLMPIFVWFASRKFAQNLLYNIQEEPILE